ncbi:MAG: HD domain-containing protein [Crenarchaeota archaeon]|nr:HD domain-containing protein [Thermoproteota archaeon]
MVIVKANVIPVRVKRLLELSREVLSVSQPERTLVLDGNAFSIQSSWIVGLSDAHAKMLWNEFLERLRGLLEHLASAVRVLISNNKMGKDRSEILAVLDATADIIAYALKWPLYGYGARHTNILAPHIGVIAYKLLRLVCRDFVEKKDRLTIYHQAYEWIMHAKPNAERLCGSSDEVITKALSELGAIISELAGVRIGAKSLQQLLEYILYTIPADTRPGLNVSSLNLHLLLSSAIASAFMGSNDELRPIVRLAALLHDVGKPFDYEHHVEESVNYAKRILEPLASLELEGITRYLEIVFKLIETHHNELECIDALSSALDGNARIVCNAVINGDRYSASVDRLVDLVMHAYDCATGKRDKALCRILEELELTSSIKELAQAIIEELRKIGIAIKEGPQALDIAYRGRIERGKRQVLWSLWKNLWAQRQDLLTQVSRALAKALYKLSPQMLGTNSRSSDGSARVKLLVVDIGGIQTSIRETLKLRVLAGISLAIDYLTYVAIPLTIDEVLGAPIESIVFAGGGTLHAIVRPDADSSCGDRVRRRALEGLLGLVLPGVHIRIGLSDIDLDAPFGYAFAISRAYSAIDAERISVKKVNGLRLNAGLQRFTKPCAYCYVRPAQLRLGSDAVCLTCFIRYKASELMGYNHRLRRLEHLLESVDPKLIDRLRSYLKDPLRLLALPYRDSIAFLKADGNLTSVLMSASITPSTYYEKSVRVDLALRRGLQTVLEILNTMLRRGANEREAVAAASTLTLSLLYAGGDDVAAILPAGLALPFAMLLSYTFAAELGFLASLSVGIAAGPRHQPIWWLYEAADKLLEEAKSNARELVLTSLLSVRPLESVASLCYDYSRRALTWTKAIRKLREERLGPLPLFSRQWKCLLHIAAALMSLEVSPQEFPLTLSRDEELEKLLANILRNSLSSTKALENMKELNRILTIYPSIYALPFILAEEDGGRHPLYRLVIEVSANDIKLVPRLLLELYTVSKLMGG